MPSWITAVFAETIKIVVCCFGIVILFNDITNFSMERLKSERLKFQYIHRCYR